ncbi:hypothetical protein NW072_00915 [Mycoplasmopsis felis]|nr:hypothetical protein [Mycoplasmopsis felis]UWV79754.1 hypothetical protein NW072_00915 [Mycoplasmopsis felis]
MNESKYSEVKKELEAAKMRTKLLNLKKILQKKNYHKKSKL